MDSESSPLAAPDLDSFLYELRSHEQRRRPDGATVVERLERCLGRLQEVILFVEPTAPVSGAGETNPREVLVQMVLMAQLLGWGMWAAGSGEQEEEGSFRSFLSLREVLSRRFAEVGPDELVDIVRTELTSSMEYLCLADSEQLARAARLGPSELTAPEIGELLLCAHIEMSIEQLEQSVHVDRSGVEMRWSAR